MGETKSARKPFGIPKMLIWKAYLKVKGNKEAYRKLSLKKCSERIALKAVR